MPPRARCIAPPIAIVPSLNDPTTNGDTASDAASGVAHGVGKAINKGLMSGIGAPLLVGGLLAAMALPPRQAERTGGVAVDRLALILGGGTVAAYLWSRTDRKNRPRATPDALPGTWVWPVAAWKGRKPVVSDGFDSPRAGRIRHGGVDVMFARLPADTFEVRSPSGSKKFVMPDNVPVVAASDGVVWSACRRRAASRS